MGNAGRPEYHLAGARMELVVADLKHVLALKYEPQFVFVLVNVEGCIKRRDLFDDGERTGHWYRRRL